MDEAEHLVIPKSELGGVEWLEQELKRNGLVNDSDISMNIETAKRIEKEQKEAAKIFGHQEGYNIYIQSFDEFGEPKWDEGKLYHRQQGFIEGYKKGYKKAKEDFKYTEEDLKIAINMARNFPYIKKGEVKFDTPIEKIIQSLQQPKYPVAFDCEMVDKGEEDWIGDDITGEPFWNQKLEPKTIINSQGLTQLVGKYIY